MRHSLADKALHAWRTHHNVLKQAESSVTDINTQKGCAAGTYHLFSDGSVLFKDSVNSPPLVDIVQKGTSQWQRFMDLLAERNTPENMPTERESPVPAFCTIDPGTHHLGIAKFTGLNYLSSTSLEAPDAPLETRIAWLMAQLQSITKEWKTVEVLVLESTSGMEGYRPAPELRAMTRRIQQWAKEKGWEIAHYHPNQVAAAVRLKGMPDKDRKHSTSTGVGALYGQHFTHRKRKPTQDELDAIAIAHCHASHLHTHAVTNGYTPPIATPRKRRHKLTRHHSPEGATHASWILHYDRTPVAHIQWEPRSWIARSWATFEHIPVTRSHTRQETIEKTLEALHFA